jgi:pyruvate dehydrogenase (quinone)
MGRPSSMQLSRAEEMPNLPHVSLETMGHYALAKVKEALLAVTGR